MEHLKLKNRLTVLLVTFSFQLLSQVNNSGYAVCKNGLIENGYVRIEMLDLKVAIIDTPIVNNCRYACLGIADSMTINLMYFKLLESKSGKEIPNYLSCKKCLFYKGLYYRLVYFTTIGNERFMILQIGRKKQMKKDLNPLFDKELDQIIRLPKSGQCN